MATWTEFTAAEPDLAGRVRELLVAYKHHTMATLRRDGSPRISGTEVDFVGDDLVIGIMAGARRVADLLRDGRVAIHGHSVDPEEDDPSAWPGEAKVAGVAVEVPHDGEPDSHRFRIELREVVFTRVGSPADHLLIESWHPARGLDRIERR